MRPLPDPVRQKALAAGAQRWLEGLDDLVAAIEEEWAITTGEPFVDATEALVVEAATSTGERAVLKLVLPSNLDAARNEITALEVDGGSCCARVLRADPDRGALLVERLGRPMSALGLPLPRRLEILCSLAVCMWRPARGVNLPTGAEKARWLAEFITSTWDELDRPCSEAAVAEALTCSQRREAAHDDERAVLVHGDIQQWNALEAGDGFKLVDPDGLLAEPAYDLGVLMREDPQELLGSDPRARARWLAARADVDPVAIWEWGVVERVATGLLCTRIGLQPVGREMLAAADRVVT